MLRRNDDILGQDEDVAVPCTSDRIKLNEEILEQLQQLSARDDVSVGKLSKLIAGEPKLGSEIIKLAAAKNCGNGAPVTTIAQAVMKLGAATLCQTYGELLQKEKHGM